MNDFDERKDLSVRLPEAPRRRSSDRDALKAAWETLLQYKALGALSVVLLMAAGVVFWDMRADAKRKEEQIEKKGDALLEVVKQNASLVERSNGALENSTRAVEAGTKAIENNTRVFETFGDRMTKVERRIEKLENP
jgi:hypothetical protein